MAFFYFYSIVVDNDTVRVSGGRETFSIGWSDIRSGFFIKVFYLSLLTGSHLSKETRMKDSSSSSSSSD